MKQTMIHPAQDYEIVEHRCMDLQGEVESCIGCTKRVAIQTDFECLSYEDSQRNFIAATQSIIINYYTRVKELRTSSYR